MHTLRELGFERKLVLWLKSYFEDRKVELRFDGVTTATRTLTQGTPQGSPLSPVLFILYITTLYRRLEAVPHLVTVGFADDTNLLAIARDTPQVCKILEEGFAVCDKWAAERGMSFNPKKSELLHFTRTRRPRTETVAILGEGQPGLEPKEAARFLRVTLDRKLSYKNHLQAIRTKMATQTLALSRLMGKTWGVRLSRTREIYTKVIRSVLSNGATAWHTPTATGKNPRGIARSLAQIQTDNLRKVIGAYKAAPVQNVESKA
jgi:hypothetical protein